MKTNVTYHTDHLGNNSFVTDNSGKAIQELRYTPYGEILSNKRSTGSNYNTPYKFSAKEKDQETGFNYFGARYYVDYMYVWLSVDPMSDKYPWISPYAYTLNNPVKFVDTDGKIIRNTKGNIVYATNEDRGIFEHPSESKATLEIGYVLADDGTPVQVFKNINGDAGWDTNCHGTTFTDGKYWLNNDQVPTLLDGDGYKEIKIEKAKVGDKIVYHGESNSEHSMTITKTDGTMKGTEVYGQGGLEVENHTDKANKAWSKPQNSTVVRKENPDKIATDKEIKNLRRSINNE